MDVNYGQLLRIYPNGIRGKGKGIRTLLFVVTIMEPHSSQHTDISCRHYSIFLFDYSLKDGDVLSFESLPSYVGHFSHKG